MMIKTKYFKFLIHLKKEKHFFLYIYIYGDCSVQSLLKWLFLTGTLVNKTIRYTNVQ